MRASIDSSRYYCIRQNRNFTFVCSSISQRDVSLPHEVVADDSQRGETRTKFIIIHCRKTRKSDQCLLYNYIQHQLPRTWDVENFGARGLECSRYIFKLQWDVTLTHIGKFITRCTDSFKFQISLHPPWTCRSSIVSL